MGRPKKNLEVVDSIVDPSTLIMGQIEKLGVNVLDNLDDLACDFYLSTGIWGFDYVLGGGIPSCAVVEVHGDNGVGKSSIALQVCDAALKEKKIEKPYHVDTEMAVNDKLARIFLKNSGIKWLQPPSGPVALNTIKLILKQTKHSFIVLDSVGATIPDDIAEGNVEDAHIGRHAKLFSQFGPIARTYARINQNILFCLNQETTNISPMSRGGGKPTGGKRWGFVPDIRIKLVKKFNNGTLKNSDGDIIGHIIEATVTKNRFGVPWRTVELPLIYGVGFDIERDLIQNAADTGVVQKSGVWYNYGEQRLGQGMAKACGFLKENTELKEKILKELNEVAL